MFAPSAATADPQSFTKGDREGTKLSNDFRRKCFEGQQKFLSFAIVPSSLGTVVFALGLLWAGQNEALPVNSFAVGAFSLLVSMQPQRVFRQPDMSSDVRGYVTLAGLTGFVGGLHLSIVTWTPAPTVFLLGYGGTAYFTKTFLSHLYIPAWHFLFVNFVDSLLWTLVGLYRFAGHEEAKEMVPFVLAMSVLPFFVGCGLRHLQTSTLTDAEMEVQQRLRAEQARDVFPSYIMHEMRNPLSGAALLVYEFLESLKDLAQSSRDRRLSPQSFMRATLQEAVRLRQLASLMASQIDKMRTVGDDVLQETERRAALLKRSAKAALTPCVSAKEGVKKEIPWVVFRVSVIDSGVGLSEEDRQKLFRPYGQVRAGELQNGGGTGLGLCICKAFVEEHAGGRVGVESAGRGEGSTFFFQIRLPLVESEATLTNRSLREESSGGKIDKADVLSSEARRESILSHFSDDVDSGGLSPELLIRSNGIVKSSRSDLELEAPLDNDDGATPSTKARESVMSPKWTTSEIRSEALTPQQQQQQQEEKEDGEAQMEGGGGESEPEPADVLLVDDDRFCLMAGSAAIRRLGFSVRTAEDGEEACDLIISQKASFRFVIIEKNMARMEGPEAITRLCDHFSTSREPAEEGRQHAHKGPTRPCIIGYTGDATPEAKQVFLRAGADRVIFKPLQPTRLAETLKELQQLRFLMFAPPPLVSSPTPSPEPTDILLVDDDRFCLMAGPATIRRLGFSVRTAEDGEEACDLIISQKASFRFVIIDNHMPRMGGPEAVKRLVDHFSDDTGERSCRQDRPVIIGCTGDTTSESHSLFTRAGAEHVLLKPLHPPQLAETLRHLEASSHQRKKKDDR
uniref:histidine kinase n=1 Tax=Chromera velia CCMP2878 TaxID=1169474 RepID=A0A0G4F0J5_9ALVE|eukprot:Cvel_14587.t1-p1 / transcript=Cvel_14587.t1 / gene=Cvel_14587 / organism=Chromera_velia_CCMP2878 / gene_product=Response regulator MprA, putative / transcript_product=Response regulator MprA, putative / location=Cvel_scaffold1043:15437-18832(+) / protein_length=851 / sequence_SO=supercontig / SO=protein_coding / is_pseudo=false